MRAVFEYQKHYQPSTYTLNKISHGKSPLIMESNLLSQLYRYDADIIRIMDYQNHELEPIHSLIFQLEKMLIMDIIRFATYADGENVTRSLDINGNSCFTYILKSLDAFYLMFNFNGQMFESDFLHHYFRHIIINPYNIGKIGFILGSRNIEEGRAQLRNRIMNSHKYFQLQ